MAGRSLGAGEVPGPWDPGLQPERTALAWQRTGLAAVVASLVGFRDGVVAGDVVTLGLAVVAFGCSVSVLRAAQVEVRGRLDALREGRGLPSPSAVPAAVAAVLALGATALSVLAR